MKISIVIPELVSLGGGQKFVSEVSRIWEKEHEVGIHTLYWNRKAWALENVCALKERERVDSAFNLYSPFLIKKLEKQATADVYNTHLFPANWFGKKPQVWYAHDPPRMLYDLSEEVMRTVGWAKRPLLAACFPALKYLDRREALKNVDRFVGNSKYCANYLAEVYGRKAQFIYPGVDHKRFKPSKPDGSDLLTIARLHPAKRVDVCIRAMALVKKEFPEAKLRIAGDGPQRKSLEGIAKELGLEESVTFLGSISESQLIKEYETAYAVLYLPLREPFGLVPLEGGAAGKPIVAANEGGCRETIINGKTGFLVSPTAQGVANAAAKLLRDNGLACRMGTAGKKRAKEFTWTSTAKKLLAVLKNYNPA